MSSRPLRPILTAARAEAELARHGYVGLEHLFISLTKPECPETAALLAEFGITTEGARDVVRQVISSGQGDGPAYDSATLLATLGIDLDEIRRCVDTKFGPNAISDLYASPLGWSLRRRGPLCGPALSPDLKRVVDKTLGHCWDTSPPNLHERLLLNSMDSDGRGMGTVLEQLGIPSGSLRSALATRLQRVS
jgi:hypothetical protein